MNIPILHFTLVSVTNAMLSLYRFHRHLYMVLANVTGSPGNDFPTGVTLLSSSLSIRPLKPTTVAMNSFCSEIPKVTKGRNPYDAVSIHFYNHLVLIVLTRQ